MKKKITAVVCCLLALIIVVAIGVIKSGYYYRVIGSNFSHALIDARPAEASNMPDSDTDIDKIRITAHEYSITTSSSDPGYGNFQDTVPIQIYYGTLSDNQWHDAPSESYELTGIWVSEGMTGFDAAGEHHIVRIGDLILICFVDGFYYPESNFEISDSLGTEVLEPFANYSSRTNMDNEFGYFKEYYEGFTSLKWDYRFSTNFPRFYYVILDYTALPDDYLLELNWSDSDGKTGTFTLTSQDIIKVLD